MTSSDRPGLPALVRLDTMEGLNGPSVRLLCPGHRRQGPPMQIVVALFRRAERVTDRSVRVGRPVERSLLLVKDDPAKILSPLAFVELCLVSIAAILGETQLDLTATSGSHAGDAVVSARTVGIERQLRFVERLLVAVGPDLLAFGDALIQVDQRLFLVEFGLLAGAPVCAGGTHVLSPSVEGRGCARSSGAGRPMWKPWA